MYKTEELEPLVSGQETIWIGDGRIMDPPPHLDDIVKIIPHSAVWAERICHQIIQQSHSKEVVSRTTYLSSTGRAPSLYLGKHV